METTTPQEIEIRKLCCPPGDCFRQAFWWAEAHHAAEAALGRRVFIVHGFPHLAGGLDGADMLDDEAKPYAGMPYAHAWCEVEEDHDMPLGCGRTQSITVAWVVDASKGGIGNPNVLPLALYYKAGRIEDHAPPLRYTPAEAAEAFEEWRHFGAWEEYPEGVLFRNLDGEVEVATG